MGGDEMFGGCLDQQPGLKEWMAAQNISDYNALQQYFTKRLLSEVMPMLQPQPPIVVWELSSGLQISDSSLTGANDIGQVYGDDASGTRMPLLQYMYAHDPLAERFAHVCQASRG